MQNIQGSFLSFTEEEEAIYAEALMLEEEVMEEEEDWSKPEKFPESVELNLELDEMMLAIDNGELSIVSKEKNPADTRVTSMEEIIEKIHEMRRRDLSETQMNSPTYSYYESDGVDSRALRLLYLSQSEAATLGDAIRAYESGNPENSLDILASTVVTGICFGASWAAAAATGGVSVAAAPLFCAAAAFWSGIIFSSFDWINGIFGTPSNDDAWWAVEAGDSSYADGNSLGISYHRSGEVDKDSLGFIKRGQVKESREDLDAKHLIAIELRVENTDDVCVKNMLFRVGKQPSGTGKVEELSIPAPVFSYITKTPLHNTKQMCIYFGDFEGAIGNFMFHWPSALTCQKNFGAYFTLDYAKCLTWAMYRYDVRRNGRYMRSDFGTRISLPSYYRSPMNDIHSRGVSSLCVDLKGRNLSNRTPVTLHKCNRQGNQKFDFDVDGRLRSALDPTKCVEAGKRGDLYAKLYIYDCHNGKWQQWQRYTNGRIKNKHHGKYIGTAYCKRESGSALELRWREDGPCGEAQKFSW
jgi:hypothetical protein